MIYYINVQKMIEKTFIYFFFFWEGGGVYQSLIIKQNVNLVKLLKYNKNLV